MKTNLNVKRRLSLGHSHTIGLRKMTKQVSIFKRLLIARLGFITMKLWIDAEHACRPSLVTLLDLRQLTEFEDDEGIVLLFLL